MRPAYVMTPTAAPRWSDAKVSGRSQIAALGEIDPQSRLDDGCQRWRRLLRLDIAIHGRGEVIGDSDRGPLHTGSIAPVGEIGAMVLMKIPISGTLTKPFCRLSM